MDQIKCVNKVGYVLRFAFKYKIIESKKLKNGERNIGNKKNKKK